jgi:hypothetical protein
MWTRKSKQEIQAADREAELKRTSFVRPLYWAIPIALLCTILYSYGYRGGITRGYVMYGDPITLLGTKSLFIWVVTFVILYSLMSISQRRGGLFSGDDILLCAECQEPSHANLERRCSCGGRQEPFSHFTWDEELQAEEMATR